MGEALDPLVSTKLRPSQARPKLVARPRLIKRLDPEAGRRLTLVSAPAGFGKTTLVGKWAEDRADKGRPVAWLSLDEDDDDPARFLAYLVAAIGRGTGEEGFGEGVLAALRSPEPPRMEAVLGAFVNEVAALPGEIDLVLDDYHLVESEGVHRVVSFMLERLPESVHLVISSRVNPPLPLSRMHARGQMAELSASELSFTREEAVAFLKGVMGLDLSAEDVAKLEERTEGWIAGLQLAALSMRDRRDISGFIESFSGSHRDVLDFLAEEVLERQPTHVREFLLETSILNNLTGSLCDALTGRSDGQETLERLERENLFVVALDDERLWYRYHHLFADFLRDRLGREHPERVGELHLSAAQWNEQNGRLSSAIEHALSIPDHDLAARLIEEGVEGAVERGEGTTALRWLEILPTEAKRRRPRLFVEHAVALVISGRPDDAEPLLIEAERAASVATGGEDGRSLLGFVSTVRSWLARLRGDAPEAVELARQALSLLPDGEAPLRNYAAVRLGDALRAVGDLAAADEAYTEAAEIDRAARHAYGRLAGVVMHARVRAEQGRLWEADEAFRHALRLLREGGFELSPAAGVVHMGMVDIRYERDDLDGAERALERGVELVERTGDVSTLVWAYVTLSRTRWARGEERGALEGARQAERVARESGADLQIAIALAWMTRLRLARGELTEAVALEQERAANADVAAEAARVVDRLTSARLLLAQGRPREALPLLEGPREEAEASGRTRDLIEILTLRALAQWASNEKEQAVSTLGGALALAQPEGYVRTFVDEGKPIAELLSGVLEAQQRGRLDPPVPAHYLRKLLAALERDASGAGLPAAGFPEPPSERELEVLQLVAAGKTNREIASELFVSVGTVKTHLNNLYRKLNARSRTQALARARELDLI
ncbi:MAG TPA: LuxR C-terminal-related transcriptional regulator [Rubrobacteraceae bacterium]|nr:LuxR C-terminal-related transcriptional regulator [Rubrobacteraceae bacterium]